MVNLRSADLSFSNFVMTDLIMADLIEADLSNANIQSSNVTGTRLRDANLKGTTTLYLVKESPRVPVTSDILGIPCTLL